MQWLEITWPKRDLLRSFMKCFFPIHQCWRLKLVSRPVQLDIWYQCCEDKTVVPEKADAQVASEWHKLQRLTPTFEGTHHSTMLVVNMIRERFASYDGLWSLPLSWLDATADPPPCPHLLDSLQLVATSEVPPRADDRLYFFVANSMPERKALVVPAHIRMPGSQVYVVAVEVSPQHLGMRPRGVVVARPHIIWVTLWSIKQPPSFG